MPGSGNSKAECAYLALGPEGHMIGPMKHFFSQFTIAKRGQKDTFYEVNRDGALVLNRDGLLKSGRMNRQLDAARDLKVAADKARSAK